MSRYALLRRVPPWIEEGLDDGSLRKGPGGVIRHRTGVNKDSIAAVVRASSTNGSTPPTDHLDALPEPIETRAPIRSQSESATDEQRTDLLDTASQIASAVDLYVSEYGPSSIAATDVISDVLYGFALARLDGHLQLIERTLSTTLQMVQHSLAALRDLGDLQIVGFSTEVGRGIELLQRGLDSGQQDYFERAVKRLEEGIADVKTVLLTMNGEQMLENPFRTQHLLRVAALSASGEIQAMALAHSNFETRIASLKAHRSLWKEVHDRLHDTPGPATRLPTLAMLQTQKNQGLMRTRRQWIQECRRMLEILEIESAFLEAIEGIAISDTRATSREGTKCDEEGTVLCLVNRETMPSR